MTPIEKEEEMRKFARNETQVLVATSVVEVGVNVPNATVILIEGAERFGLAQLHQLRGRVIRSNDQAYCFLQSESKAQATSGRLKALTTAKNGFELAEADLALRGSGELYGARQWGVSDVAMEALSNLKMVEAARGAAKSIIEKDVALTAHPLLQKRIALLAQNLYGE
jgi:ATP-dependent DNA helicase RecG